MRGTKLLIACVALMVAFAGQVRAGTILFNFTGTATKTTGIWSGQGTDVSGSFSYDSLLVDSIQGNSGQDVFQSSGPPPNGTLLWDITVNLGTVTRSTSDNVQSVGRLVVIDQFRSDQFILEALQFDPSDDFANIRLLDNSPSREPDGVAVGSYNLTDAAPRSIALSKFDLIREGVYKAINNGSAAGRVNFEITSIAPVPEPTSLAIFGFGALTLVAGGIRRRRKTQRV